MEGKALAMAICGDPSDGLSTDPTRGDIISVDFGGPKSQGRAPKSPAFLPAESLFAPLDGFISGDGDVQWHDAARGLAAVGSILKKLTEGTIVELAPDFEFGDDEELTEGVRGDLEELEKILAAAQKARVRFRLTFEV